MKAGLVTGLRRAELVEVPEPSPAPEVAVVEVAYCGICGTDVHAFLSDQPYNPAICGHEFGGTVVAVGPDVPGDTGVAEGRRVVLGTSAACGRCGSCRAGQVAWCTSVFLDSTGRGPQAPAHGGFAPYVAVPARRLLPVPDALSDAEVALIEPATVALHAVHRTPPRVGDTVVVQGCGPIGLLTLQWAREAGAGRLVAVEPHGPRRAVAEALGAEAVAPEAAADAVGEGADVVYECAGVPATLQRAVELVRRGGTVSLVGLASGTAAVHPGTWLVKEVTVVASLAYLRHEFAEAMAAAERGRLDLAAVHDATAPLSGFPDAIARLADDPTSAVKVLIDPRA
jgi:(R,R)-butanediol dehydrogenase/meso-butanediol dehydrogenase/diacetyl reductase